MADLTCPKCNSQMQSGFILDHGFGGRINQPSVWIRR